MGAKGYTYVTTKTNFTGRQESTDADQQRPLKNSKGYTYFGAERRPLPQKSCNKTKLSLAEKLREIVAEVMGVDAIEVSDSYPIRHEAQMMPDGYLDLVEIAVVIEKEFKLGEVFTEENEQVFESFGTLHNFLKGLTNGR